MVMSGMISLYFRLKPGPRGFQFLQCPLLSNRGNFGRPRARFNYSGSYCAAFRGRVKGGGVSNQPPQSINHCPAMNDSGVCKKHSRAFQLVTQALYL